MTEETKTKYKVGDKVRVREDLKENHRYNGRCLFTHEMKSFCGKIVTIKKALKKIDGEERYNIKESIWHFTNDMLEPVEPISINDLQFGDILTLRNGERYVYARGYMYGEKGSYYFDRLRLELHYNTDLTGDNNIEYDIMKVERKSEIVYKREDVREMTIAEISEVLGYEVKVIK